MGDVTIYVTKFTDWLLAIAPSLILAIAILIGGFWLIARLNRLIAFGFEKAQMAPEVVSFLGSFADVTMKVILVLAVAGTLGFELSALLGVLAAATFAVGLALQGSLGNFAAGLTILIFRPYRIGDWVEISERFGKVESIDILTTSIVTPGQKMHIVPNGQVMEGVITNYSTKGVVRLELQVTMPYAESFPRVRDLIIDTLGTIDYVKHDPAPMVGIETYDSHSIVLTVRPYVDTEDFWDATFAVNERIKAAFHAADVQVAYSEGVELGPIGA